MKIVYLMVVAFLSSQSVFASMECEKSMPHAALDFDQADFGFLC